MKFKTHPIKLLVWLKQFAPIYNNLILYLTSAMNVTQVMLKIQQMKLVAIKSKTVPFTINIMQLDRMSVKTVKQAQFKCLHMRTNVL